MITEVNIKSISVLVAICGLIFSVVKFIHIQEIEAAKPFLEKKLMWCEQAVETASSIANSKDESPVQWDRFWALYWGVMGLVEKKEIQDAMVDFGHGADENKTLKEKSLALAHACRAELANDWSPSWSR